MSGSHSLCNLLLSVGYRYSRAGPPAFDRNNEQRWQAWHVNQAMYLLPVSEFKHFKFLAGLLTMLAHCLSIGPCKLRSQSPDTVVELLDLGFSQDSTGRLML